MRTCGQQGYSLKTTSLAIWAASLSIFLYNIWGYSQQLWISKKKKNSDPSNPLKSLIESHGKSHAIHRNRVTSSPSPGPMWLRCGFASAALLPAERGVAVRQSLRRSRLLENGMWWDFHGSSWNFMGFYEIFPNAGFFAEKKTWLNEQKRYSRDNILCWLFFKKQRRPPIIKDDKDVKDGDVEISWDIPSDNQTWLNSHWKKKAKITTTLGLETGCDENDSKQAMPVSSWLGDVLWTMELGKSGAFIYWLVVDLPLWKIWVRQLGLLFQIYGKS